MRTPTTRVTPLALAAAVALVTACGGKDDRAATTDTAAGTVTPPSSNVALAVREVRIGNKVDANKRVTDESDDFEPRDTIWASVYTNGSTPNATLSAVWRFQDGQLVDSSALNIAPNGDATTEFYIAKPDAWPKGKYTLTVLLNGVEARRKEFEID